MKKPSKLIEYDAHVGWRAQEDTLQKLVDCLVPAFLGFEPSYVPNFLRTYRAFATTGQVLNALLGRSVSQISRPPLAVSLGKVTPPSSHYFPLIERKFLL